MLAALFMLIALILFVVAAFGVGSRINLVAAGLAFMAASMLAASGFGALG